MRFGNEDKVEVYLKHHTKLDWEPITPVYLRYKILYNHHRQFCLFAPGDWVRKYPYSRLYIPNNKIDLHDIQTFLGYLNNAKRDFIKVMPWIVFNFDKKTPSLQTQSLTAIGSIYYIIKYSLKFTDHIALRPIGSISDGKLAFYPQKATTALENCLFDDVASIRFDIPSNKLSFGVNILGKYSGNKLEVIPPNKLTAKLAPIRIITKNAIPGWEINGKLGYELSATFNQVDEGKQKSIITEGEQLITQAKKNFFNNMRALVIFVKELGEGLANEVPPLTPMAPPPITTMAAMI